VALSVGLLEVHPGAVNSIPSHVFLTVDIRDIDGGRRDQVLDSIRHACGEIGVRRGVATEVEVVNADPPATCAPDIVRAVQRAAAEADASTEVMVSRAYHDALFMAQVCPTGMIFIPCRGGVSHRPDEYASPGAIARGAAVLAHALAELSR
jgi:N-carbamoyl-L-amino-acid hydrolase